MKLIFASAKDPAAQTIVTQLLGLYSFERVQSRPEAYAYGDVLLMTTMDDATQIATLPLAADEVIIASRHASESGKPTLTVHAPGDVAGRKLAITSPATIKAALKALSVTSDELSLPYGVSLEATHHGPVQLEVPVTFVEIGSSLAQWRDEAAAEAVARAIMSAATSRAKGRQAVGFGGPHYAPRHSEVVLRTDVCIGHILPKYVNMDEELVEQAIARTYGGVELLALDWKGLSSEQRQLLQRVAAKFGLQAIREGELLATQNV
ncbi:MAG: D-aminoacyl-tRNA deacylase [Candidatus Hodarchaeaceae archaeon]|nr:D-aminoacyl-tRNA deacylase [Candidatus Hodarchaeaceae archaeon]